MAEPIFSLSGPRKCYVTINDFTRQGHYNYVVIKPAKIWIYSQRKLNLKSISWIHSIQFIVSLAFFSVYFTYILYLYLLVMQSAWLFNYSQMIYGPHKNYSFAKSNKKNFIYWCVAYQFMPIYVLQSRETNIHRSVDGRKEEKKTSVCITIRVNELKHKN